MKNEYVDNRAVLESLGQNLSDFALFLSVMKNKEAHEIVLRIIMENPELQLEEIHVEQVVLNKSGKRAIRLDACAKDTEGTQYNTEMQNDTGHDDVRKRSRFYQGLMDTPILKSGKETKYKQLPPTVIIFITQEDIFGEDLVKYTFTEQCEEVEGLHLEDGTTKIFLNMASKNGTPELVSLLQYMKKTTLDNPEILVHDDKMRKLDSIVTEVKESDEWEEARMSIFSVAMEQGEARGKEAMLVEIICKMLRRGKTASAIADELEVDIKVIEQICEMIVKSSPEYDCEKASEAWLSMKKK